MDFIPVFTGEVSNLSIEPDLAGELIRDLMTLHAEVAPGGGMALCAECGSTYPCTTTQKMWSMLTIEMKR